MRVPKLRAVTTRSPGKPKPARRAHYDHKTEYEWRYRAKRHEKLPHVVKFSGGRSSAMLLFALLKGNILKAKRGDVIVFNNTSCEHPETYNFVRACKEKVEKQYGIPFFWIEYQTYEDASGGEWTRLGAYRLVNSRPYDAKKNPEGFHWKGEVFEEMTSQAGFVPNQFQRTCTKALKLEATRLFLADWLACKEGISRLGHYAESSRINREDMYHRHTRRRGEVPKEIFFEKKSYVWSRPTFRPGQKYADFSDATGGFRKPPAGGGVYGERARFGPDGIEYVALVGLRADEPHRVAKVKARNSGGPEAAGYEGEHVYMPLAEMAVAQKDVNAFWEAQEWDLGLPSGGSLSNCVYCFLKGARNLGKVHKAMEQRKKRKVRGFGPTKGTPCDIAWWERIEQTYGRDLEAEQRERKNPDVQHIGFFGATSKFSYRVISESHSLSQYEQSVLPCDCTD